MRASKRLLSALMAIVLVLGLCPGLAFANGEGRGNTASALDAGAAASEADADALDMSSINAALSYMATEDMVEAVQSTQVSIDQQSTSEKMTLFAQSASESEESYSYDQYLADWLVDYSSLEFYLDEFQNPYRTFVDQASDDMKNAMVAWKYGTLGTGAISEYTTKESAFYQTLIFDVVYEQKSNTTLMGEVNKNFKALNASTWKTLADATVKINANTPVDADNLPEMFKVLENAQCISDALKWQKSVIKFADHLKTFENLVVTCCKIQAIYDASDEVAVILRNMLGNAGSGRESLHNAITEFCLAYEDNITEDQIYAIIVGGDTVDAVVDFCLEEAWSKGMDALGEVGWAVKAGQTVGRFGGNILVSTDKICEEFYSMERLIDFEDALVTTVRTYKSRYEASRTTANAKLLNQAVSVYFRTLYSGLEHSIDYVTVLYQSDEGISGIVQKFQCVYRWMTGQFSDLEELLRNLNSIQSLIQLDINFMLKDTYNLYIEEYGSAVPGGVAAENLTTSSNDAKLAVADLSVKSFVLNSQSIDEGMTLDADKETWGDLEIDDKPVDLNGHMLTVRGNVTITGGGLNLHGGKLVVWGDLIQPSGSVRVNGEIDVRGCYRIQNPYIDATGEMLYGMSYGRLYMDDASGVIRVGGDFACNPYRGNEWELTAGTMYVGGDFSQCYSPSASWDEFAASDSHRVVLTGSGAHAMRFDASDSKLAALEVADGGSISSWTGYMYISKAESDLNIPTSGVSFIGLVANGHTITLNGSLDIATGTLNAQKGKVNVRGDLIQSGGGVEVAKGEINVTGNYHIQKASLNSAGDYDYSSTSGYLKMLYPEDKVMVNGDLYFQSSTQHGSSYLKDGKLYVAGDFSDISGNFRPSDQHLTILNGSEPQRASFPNTTAKFNKLQLVQDRQMYVFSPDDCWKKLVATDYVDPRFKPSVTAVVVSPKSVVAAQGDNQQFSAIVFGMNGITQDVSWSLTGAKSSATMISADGLLSIGSDESADELTVIATSASDPMKTGRATVSVRHIDITTAVTKITLTAGDTYTFRATVSGTNGVSQDVTWSVAGAKSNGTSISPQGVLTVASDEPSGTLTVTAASVDDPSSTAEVVITVKGETVDDEEAAGAVDGLIASIPAPDLLSLDDGATVAAARVAYDALTEGQKALVVNLAVLEAAEARIAELEAASSTVDVYELHHPATGVQRFTANSAERDELVEAGWVDKGVRFKVPSHSDYPVYCLHSPDDGLYAYTVAEWERSQYIADGWDDWGIGWYSKAGDDGVPVYQVDDRWSADHVYTTNWEEWGLLQLEGWADGGIAWYASETADSFTYPEKDTWNLGGRLVENARVEAQSRVPQVGGGSLDPIVSVAIGNVELVRGIDYAVNFFSVDDYGYMETNLGAEPRSEPGRYRARVFGTGTMREGYVGSKDLAPYEVVAASGNVAVYRLLDPGTHEHLFTADAGEVSELVGDGWASQGVAWLSASADDEGTIAVYRMFYKPTGEVRCTLDAAERDSLVAGGWGNLGPSWYALSESGWPVYDLLNPATNRRFYTASAAERDDLVKYGWADGGVAWYAAGAGDAYSGTPDWPVCAVTFDSAGGSAVEPVSVTAGIAVAEPQAPTRSGYTFGGWLLGGSAYSFSAPVTADITLTASWAAAPVDPGPVGPEPQPVSYTVTFDSAGGSAVVPQAVASGGTAAQPAAPTRSGYTFGGWLLNGAPYSFSTPVTANITLTASWTVPAFAISYDLAGGSLAAGEANPGSYTSETESFTLANPVREGYEFAGWTGTGLDGPSMAVTVAKGSTGDRSYAATWKSDRYLVIFVSEGRVLSEASYAAGTKAAGIVQPAAPPKADAGDNAYVFAGWEPSLADVTADATYTAVYEVTSKSTGVSAEGEVFSNLPDGESLELVVSEQDGPSSASMLTGAQKAAYDQAVGANSVVAAFEVDLVKHGRGQVDTVLEEGVGALQLTFPVGAEYAGRRATVVQLHKIGGEVSEVIAHDKGADGRSLAVDSGGGVTIVLDGKLSEFVVAVSAEEAGSVSMTRLYNQWSGEHHYTSDAGEIETLVALGWADEGEAWRAPASGDPVYRLYNPYSGDHHYTTDRAEYEGLGAAGWRQEGVGFRSAGEGGLPVYRGFNPYVEIGTHHYTPKADEMESMVAAGWTREGVGWYGL